MKNIIRLTEENIEENLNNNAVLVVVFGSKGTPTTTDTLRIIGSAASDTKIGFINIEEERSLMREYSIRTTPTCITFKDGFPVLTLSARKLSDEVKAIEESGDISCLIG